MAEKRRKKKKVEPKGIRQEPVELSELQKRLAHVRDNPLLYGAVAAFVLMCILVAITFNLNAKTRDRRIMTQYAEAVLNEGDPAEILAKIEPVAGQDSRWNAETLYMMGETAIRAQEYDKAEEAMKQVREKFPESEYAPRAVATLAFLAENRGETENALAAYREVMEKWSGTFTARRLHYEAARLEEQLGNLENAKTAYETQIEVFPSSKVAEKAQEALARLRTSNPGLFGSEQTDSAVMEPDSMMIPELPLQEDVVTEEIPPEDESAKDDDAEDALDEMPAEDADAEADVEADVENEEEADENSSE